MTDMAGLLQNYQGGTCSMSACGAANPAVTQAALAIVSGAGRIPEHAMAVAAARQNVPQIAKGKDGNGIA